MSTRMYTAQGQYIEIEHFGELKSDIRTFLSSAPNVSVPPVNVNRYVKNNDILENSAILADTNNLRVASDESVLGFMGDIKKISFDENTAYINNIKQDIFNPNKTLSANDITTLSKMNPEILSEYNIDETLLSKVSLNNTINNDVYSTRVESEASNLNFVGVQNLIKDLNDKLTIRDLNNKIIGGIIMERDDLQSKLIILNKNFYSKVANEIIPSKQTALNGKRTELNNLINEYNTQINNIEQLIKELQPIPPMIPKDLSVGVIEKNSIYNTINTFNYNSVKTETETLIKILNDELENKITSLNNSINENRNSLYCINQNSSNSEPTTELDSLNIARLIDLIQLNTYYNNLISLSNYIEISDAPVSTPTLTQTPTVTKPLLVGKVGFDSFIKEFNSTYLELQSTTNKLNDFIRKGETVYQDEIIRLSQRKVRLYNNALRYLESVFTILLYSYHYFKSVYNKGVPIADPVIPSFDCR